MVTLFTGGIDNHYACGLGKSLAMSGTSVDVICNTDMDTHEMRNTANLRLITLYDKPPTSEYHSEASDVCPSLSQAHPLRSYLICSHCAHPLALQIDSLRQNPSSYLL